MAGLSWVRPYSPPHHRRPANTDAERLAAQVRGVVAERLAERLEAGLPHLCKWLGLTAEQGSIILGCVLAIADPAEYADDPAVAGFIEGLGKPELVPVTGLERCGPPQLTAYLNDPPVDPPARSPYLTPAEKSALAAALSVVERTELRDIILARTARLRGDPLVGLRRLLTALPSPPSMAPPAPGGAP